MALTITGTLGAIGGAAAIILGLLHLLRAATERSLRTSHPAAEAAAEAEASRLLSWGEPEPLSDEWLARELGRVDAAIAAARAEMDRNIAQCLGCALAEVVDTDERVLAQLARDIVTDTAQMRALGDTQEMAVIQPRGELVSA